MQVDVSSAGCSDCHGDATTSAPDSGLHRIHLEGREWSRGVACSSCHVVPTGVLAPGHIDTTEGAELRFAGLATHAGSRPTWDAEQKTCTGGYCHGGDARPSGAPTLRWSDDEALSCGGCHGVPPDTLTHRGLPSDDTGRCAACHPSTVRPDGDIDLEGRAHINGVVEVF